VDEQIAEEAIKWKHNRKRGIRRPKCESPIWRIHIRGGMADKEDNLGINYE